MSGGGWQCSYTWEFIDVWTGKSCLTSRPKDRVWMPTLRALLFDRLGLRHTCCRYDSLFHRYKPPVSAEEASEIHDEDAEGIDRLENLVNLAEQQLPHHKGTFSEFMIPFNEKYVENPNDEVDEDYIQAVKELGVTGITIDDSW
ncbi:hypothetical protein MMC20_003467 [Loxospora ochrophaea]|nr:hypothetical protein [Loxospora ochrophaea]